MTALIRRPLVSRPTMTSSLVVLVNQLIKRLLIISILRSFTFRINSIHVVFVVLIQKLVLIYLVVV
jgi:hypothetical protein